MPPKRPTALESGRILTPPPLIVGLVLLLSIVTPSLAYMSGAQSMAPGILAVSVAHIYLSLISGIHQRAWPAASAAVLLIFVMFAAILASSGLSLLLHAEVDPLRMIGSILIFCVFTAAVYALARTAQMLPDQTIDKAARFVFYILSASGIFGAFHLSPFSSTASKSVVFFNEPSHYSLSFLPFLFYMVVTATARRRMLLICFGFGLALALESLTLIVGTMLIGLPALRTRHMLMLSPIVIIVLAYISLDYYADRLNLSEGSDNLSTLVYLSGWERAYLNFMETRGLGVGFQQFGIVGDHGRISDIIASLIGERLNVLDGGSIGAKFIGEFGLFGIIVLMLYAFTFSKKILLIRRYIQSDTAITSYKYIFFCASFIMFSIDIFVRGIAYFSPSGLLFFTAVICLFSTRSALSQNDASPPLRQPLLQ